MRRVPKSLNVVAKATVSRARSTASNTYSTMPPPKNPDHEAEEEEVDLDELEFIPFPNHIEDRGGFVVKKSKKKTQTSTEINRDKSNEGSSGGGKEDFRGGCSGCPGCSRCGCPGCGGGCKLCGGCDGCKYEK